jgi:site-specific recombinase XerC
LGDVLAGRASPPEAQHPTRTAGIVSGYFVPKWGAVRLRDGSHADAQAWVSELSAGGLSPASVARTFNVFAQMLDVAVQDRRLASNPARGIRLPQKAPKARLFLDAGQVEALARECEPQA